MPRSQAAKSAGSPDEDAEEARHRSRNHMSGGQPAAAWEGVAQASARVRDWAAYAREAAASALRPPGASSPAAPSASVFVPSGDPRQAAAPPSADQHGPAHAPQKLPQGPASRPGSAPFTQAQTDWIRTALGDAVGASLTTFAHHVQGDIEEMRTELSTVRFEATETAVKVGRLEGSASATAAIAQRAAADAADARKALDDLTARVERLTATGSAGARTVARLGNLGWDSEPHVLQTRGLELLRMAGVPPANHGPVAPVVASCGTGSMAEVVFVDSASLQAARVAVKARRHEFVAGKAAWLDEARTRAETAPVRHMHRLADAVAELEAERADATSVVRDGRSRSVTCAGRKVAYICDERVVWTSHGVQRYSADDHAIAAAAAMAA